MVPLCPQKILGLVETRVHAALAMPATLAALGVIFKTFPALCPCEPRLPRGEMQAVPCDARSNTRLLQASTSKPPPAGNRSVSENTIPGYEDSAWAPANASGRAGQYFDKLSCSCPIRHSLNFKVCQEFNTNMIL